MWGSMDQLTRMGRWWTPDSPKRRVPGLLTVPSDDRAGLALIGTLAVDDGDTVIIRGRTTDGEPATLFDCHCGSSRGWSSLYGTTARQTYSVGTVLLGGGARDGLKAHFRFAAVGLSSLAEFIAKRPFGRLDRTDPDYRDVIGMSRGHDTHMRHRDTEIIFSVFAGQDWPGTAVTLDTRGRFSFFSQTPRTLAEWDRDYLWPVATLVSLALGRACAISEWTVLVSAPPWTYARAQRPVPEIRVLRSRLLRGPSGSSGDPPLFTLADSGVDVGALLPRWLDAYPAIRHPLDLYFSTMFAPFMYLESRFLNLVQAAEGYHRARFPGRRGEDPLVHVERLASILGSIDDRMNRAWLAERFGNHSNEPSLRQRLSDLAKLARRQGLKMTGKEAQSFAYSVKIARDELSHGGFGERKTPRDGYFKMEQQLKGVLQACWMSELGLSGGVSAEMLNRYV